MLLCYDRVFQEAFLVVFTRIQRQFISFHWTFYVVAQFFFVVQNFSFEFDTKENKILNQ